MSLYSKTGWLFTLTMMVLSLGTLGCEPEQTGGPGAEEVENGNTDGTTEMTPHDDDADHLEGDGAMYDDTTLEEQTFTAAISDDALQLQQGAQEELTLSIDRGDDFAQDVTVQIDAPAGVSATADRNAFTGDEDEITLTVMAEPGADTQEYPVQVTFQPQTGESVVKQLLVTVTPADDADQGDTAANQ